jgi:hypothetical protein
VYAVLHQIVSTAEELSGNQDDGCRSVSNFFILLLGEVDQDLAGGMFYI